MSKNDDSGSRWRPRTQMVRGGTWRSEHGEQSEAIFMTSGFVYDRAETAEARFLGEETGYQYSRLRNPTVAMFEERMRLMEGAEMARATATGMAAVTAAFLCQVRTGDHIVAGEVMFGSCRSVLVDVLPRFGVEVTMVPNSDLAAWKAAARAETTLFFLECPTNPTLEITDLKAVCDIAHEAGAEVILDNVFATSVLQKPLEFGADIVVYSATKHLDGQGRTLGGCILGRQKFLDDHLATFVRNTGPSLSPFNAWVLLKGLETLELRVLEQSRSAARVADFLAAHRIAENTRYPGREDHPQHELAMSQMRTGGTILTFDVPGGRAAAFKFLNALGLIDIANNLGDTKSLITHPASTTHQRLDPKDRARQGIGEGLVRLSVGLEDVEDITEDLDQALSRAAS